VRQVVAVAGEAQRERREFAPQIAPAPAIAQRIRHAHRPLRPAILGWKGVEGGRDRCKARAEVSRQTVPLGQQPFFDPSHRSSGCRRCRGGCPQGMDHRGEDAPLRVVRTLQPAQSMLHGAPAQTIAEIRRRNVLEMVGFVDHDAITRREHRALGVLARMLAQREVGQQEMVVHDQQACLRCFSPRRVEEAAGVERAAGAQAVVRLGGHLFPYLR